MALAFLAYLVYLLTSFAYIMPLGRIMNTAACLINTLFPRLILIEARHCRSQQIMPQPSRSASMGMGAARILHLRTAYISLVSFYQDTSRRASLQTADK